MRAWRSFLGFLALTATSIAAEKVRPNVLFIAVDDLRTNLGCYGDRFAQTPHLDRLAARGTVFARAYTQQAVCNPSRQSLLSGRRPDSIQVWDLYTHFRKTAPDVVPLPEHFKLNGYFAQAIGKIYHGFEGMADPPSWSVPEQYQYVEKLDDYRLPENRKPARGQKQMSLEFADAPEDEYPDGKAAAAAVAVLERIAREKSGRPFFLAVGIRKPHLPFTAPKKYWDAFASVPLPPVDPAAPPRHGPEIALHDSIELRGYSDVPRKGDLDAELVTRLRRGYYAATSFADAQIGRVLGALDRTGFKDNTIVVVWGDHGFHLGEHGLWTKITNYEADTRVPLIISAPGQKRRGARTDTLVELLDLYPTLIELCGLPPREKLEGRSIAGWLDDPNRRGRVAAFSQFPRPWTGRGTPEFMGYAVRTAGHRYVEWRQITTGEVVARELYAYNGDEQFERENLADAPEQRARCTEMAALLPPIRRTIGP